jgi:hypothetical protein
LHVITRIEQAIPSNYISTALLNTDTPLFNYYPPISNMSFKLIVVIGATGLQGGSVARLFASKPGWRVRGISRNPENPSNAALRELGIELVAADLNDQASLDKAFEGANVIFANTDLWQFMSDPSTYTTAEATGKKPNQVAFDREVQQGKNAVDVAAKHVDTLERFIWSTLSDTKKWSKGEFTWNMHFDSKAAVEQYIKDAQPDLAAKTSYLQVGMYLQNWQLNPALGPHKQPDGTFMLALPKAFEDYPAPLVDPSYDTGFFVQALVDAPAGSSMLGYAKEKSHGDHWRTWARIQNVKLEIQNRAFDFGDMPDYLQWEFNEALAYAIKYGFAGGDPAVKSPKDLGVDMSQLTDLEEWVRKEDYSSIL